MSVKLTGNLISKPEGKTLFALAMFSILVSACFVGVLFLTLQAEIRTIWHYLGLVTLGPLGVGMALKIILGYQVWLYHKDSLEVRHPFRRKKVVLGWRNLKSWKETVIKTGQQGEFKELSVLFDGYRPVKINNRENGNYERFVGILDKKFKDLRILA